MSKDDEAPELYRKYRPKSLKEVIGQKEAVQKLSELGKAGKIPHVLLLTGESGTGKTTIARILRKKLKCSDFDFYEVNGAEARGIDEIRKIQSRIGTAPMGGECRVWLIDEAHSQTPDAQTALLKILEDTPAHVYFMLATTDPQKLKKAIRTRATEIRCKPIDKKELFKLVTDVAEKEGRPLNTGVAKRIAEVAEGSARMALVILHAVLGIDDKDDQLAAVDSNDTKGQAIQIARTLMKKSATWAEMAEVLRSVEEDAEKIRNMVLGYCRIVLLKGDNPRAALIIEEFEEKNFYDSKTAGLARLALACYNVIHN